MRAPSGDEDVDLARRIVAAAGYPTAVVVQILMNESEFPIILFTIATPDGKRVAATGWLDGPLHDVDVHALVVAGWDIA